MRAPFLYEAPSVAGLGCACRTTRPTRIACHLEHHVTIRCTQTSANKQAPRCTSWNNININIGAHEQQLPAAVTAPWVGACHVAGAAAAAAASADPAAASRRRHLAAPWPSWRNPVQLRPLAALAGCCCGGLNAVGCALSYAAGCLCLHQRQGRSDRPGMCNMAISWK